MTNTHQILLPVDFSETAANAYRYAQAVAEKLNLGIKVVHIHQPTYDPSNPYLTGNVLNLEEETRERLKEFILNKKLDTGSIDVQARVTSKLLIGFPSDEIVRLGKDDNIDMIIMGTTGDGGMLEQLFGSVSLAVSKRIHKPVLLIPPEATFQGFSNILFGGNYESATPGMIDTMVAFARLFDSDVHFVHVKTDNSEPDHVKDTIFNELFAEGNPGITFELATVTNKKIWDGLNEYAAENDIDLITMVVPVRSWLEALLHKSVSKEMILHAQRPIMVLHTD